MGGRQGQLHTRKTKAQTTAVLRPVFIPTPWVGAGMPMGSQARPGWTDTSLGAALTGSGPVGNLVTASLDAAVARLVPTRWGRSPELSIMKSPVPGADGILSLKGNPVSGEQHYSQRSKGREGRGRRPWSDLKA